MLELWPKCIEHSAGLAEEEDWFGKSVATVALRASGRLSLGRFGGRPGLGADKMARSHWHVHWPLPTDCHAVILLLLIEMKSELHVAVAVPGR